MLRINQKSLVVLVFLLVPLTLTAAYSTTSTLPKLRGGYDTLQVLIKFPSAALDLHLQEELVKVEFFIETDGSVSDPKIISNTHPVYNSAVREALEKVEFEPATSNGFTVRVRYQLPVHFTM